MLKLVRAKSSIFKITKLSTSKLIVTLRYKNRVLRCTENNL